MTGDLGIEMIPLREIVVGARMRPVTAAGVAQLVQSIRDLGRMTNPVQLRRLDGGLLLLSGGHRLAAARELGWEAIPAKVVECTDAEAKLIEIDDNLASKGLCALELALFMAERKRIYEEMHPDATRGVAGAERRWKDAREMASFAAATAERFGRAVRWAERYAELGARLDRDAARDLMGTPVAGRLTELQQVMRQPKSDQRMIARRVREGGFDSIREVVGKPRTVSSERDVLDRLMRAWDAAPKAVRDHFLIILAGRKGMDERFAKALDAARGPRAGRDGGADE